MFREYDILMNDMLMIHKNTSAKMFSCLTVIVKLAWRLLQQVPVTAAPITRAKYLQRMNGRTMAANRTRESKNGFTLLCGVAVRIAAFCSRRFIEKARQIDFQIDTSAKQQCCLRCARPACAGKICADVCRITNSSLWNEKVRVAER